jgi:hypothetical protein
VILLAGGNGWPLGQDHVRELHPTLVQRYPYVARFVNARGGSTNYPQQRPAMAPLSHVSFVTSDGSISSDLARSS